MSYPTTPPGVSRNDNAVGVYPLQAGTGEVSSPSSCSNESTPFSHRTLPDWNIHQNRPDDVSPGALGYEAWCTAQSSIGYPGSQLHHLQSYSGNTSNQEPIAAECGAPENEQNGYTTFNEAFWQEFSPDMNFIGDYGFIGENDQVAQHHDSFNTGDVPNNTSVSLLSNNSSGEVNVSNDQNSIGLGPSLDNSDLDQILNINPGPGSFMYAASGNNQAVVNYSGDEANTEYGQFDNSDIKPTLDNHTTANNGTGEKPYVSPYVKTFPPVASPHVQQNRSSEKRKQSRGSISSDSSFKSPTKKQKKKPNQPKSPIIGVMPPLILPPQTPPSSQKAVVVETGMSKAQNDASLSSQPVTPTKKIPTLAEAINMPYSINQGGKMVKIYCPIRDPRWLKEAVIRWATENMRDQINAGILINGTPRDVETFDFVNCFNIYASVFDNKPEKRNKMILGFMQDQYTKPKDFKIINPYLPHTLSTAPDQLVGPVGPIRDGFGELDAYKEQVKRVEEANRATLKQSNESNAGYAALLKENAELKAQLKKLKDMANQIPNFI